MYIYIHTHTHTYKHILTVYIYTHTSVYSHTLTERFLLLRKGDITGVLWCLLMFVHNSRTMMHELHQEAKARWLFLFLFVTKISLNFITLFFFSVVYSYTYIFMYWYIYAYMHKVLCVSTVCVYMCTVYIYETLISHINCFVFVFFCDIV